MNATNKGENNKQKHSNHKAKTLEEYDTIIVGCGPAGLAAARECAKKGLKVLALDRKQEIGPPKRCAEGLGLGWFERLGMKPNKEWAVQEIFGAALHSPKGKKIEFRAKKVSGYVLERKVFEKHLAIEAAKAGAKIRVKSNVESLERKSGKVIVKAKESEEHKQYATPLIIAADGVDSKAARMLGMNTVNKLTDVDSGYQYEMTNIKGYDEGLLHLYFGTDTAPRGYAWIFPKRKRTANVGIGIGGSTEKSAKHYLDKFIESRPEMFGDASIIEVNAGLIPVGGFLEEMCTDNLIACGDAAHQVDPIHGGGIGLAMEAAGIAAETAAKACREQKFDKEFLGEYNKKWYEKRGNELKKRLRGRNLLEQLSNEDFEYLAESISVDDVLKIVSGEMSKKDKLLLMGTKLVKRPGLAKIMMKYFKN